MLNFTVGPVSMDEEVRTLGAEQIPYFRTAEFSDIMFENEKLILEFAGASPGSKAVFLTGSGTAGMESAVINTLTQKDKALVVNGGSFGERFVRILNVHGIPYEEIKLSQGESLKPEMLAGFEQQGFTAFIVNLHETSTGVLYDLKLIGDFCKRNSVFLIVDAISAFLADEIDCSAHGVDVMITGSQKALACPPGIAALVLSERAVDRVKSHDCGCFYLDLQSALADAERGQTPFTPAVGTLLQINLRLKRIFDNGGAEKEIQRVALLAKDFREKITGFPFKIASESMSNAVTPLQPLNVSAYEIFEVLKSEYGIWVCPNGGELKDRLFRVGHIGCLTTDDNSKLVDAFVSLRDKGMI